MIRITHFEAPMSGGEITPRLVRGTDLAGLYIRLQLVVASGEFLILLDVLLVDCAVEALDILDDLIVLLEDG
ncbi:hypothetical protein [Nocardia sp. NBC_00403]|uniref:hypothetical protein n=1 Tax=Nocardia sp. NBC_00403 TaxID=2975990 RepID=UPI002E1BE6F5